MTETLLPPRTESGGDHIPVVDVSSSAPTDVPILTYMDTIRRHGPAVVLRGHGPEMFLVSDLELVTEMADEQRFSKFVGPFLEPVREFAGDGLFTAYNDEPNWHKAHSILMPAFSLGSMRTYHPVMRRVARRLTDSWDRSAGSATPVDVADFMSRMTLDTIGLSGFGFDFGSFDRHDMHPFVDAILRCLNWAMTKLTRVPGVDYTERDEAFRADVDFVNSVVDDVISARTAAGDGSAGATEDLLGLMLNTKDPSGSTTLDLQNIRNQVITFLTAGHETTSGTLTFALYFLAKNPTVLRLVQREVDELWGDTPNPEATYEDVGRLSYTRQVLNETLRLWPTAAGYRRQARQDTVLGGRIPMRAGQSALIVSTMLHRGPVWGDNPEQFDPSRFTREAEASRSPHAFKPFGTGERACIGRQFALHEATLVLGLLAHRYRLIDQDDYHLQIKQTLTIKPVGFTLTLARRTSADRVANRAALPADTPAKTLAATQNKAEDADLPTRVRQGTGLLILHGSNYGTAREFAGQIADVAAGLGCDTSVAPLDSYKDGLPVDQPLAIVAASYNGQPTDDAAAFVEWLETAEPGSADGATYTVLGVGDRNWAATYQRIPTLIDDRLAALGGIRLVPRAEADASGDLAGNVETFIAALRTALLERYGDPDDTVRGLPTHASDGPAYRVTVVVGGPLDALAARHDMVPMTVTTSSSLTDPDYPRTKRFVRLALPEGTTYRTGDHLIVLPANDDDLVARAARVLHVDLDITLNIVPSRPQRHGIAVDRPLTVRELLTRNVELQDRPTVAQLVTLAELNPCPPEKTALRALVDDAEARANDQRTLLDLIEEFPALRDVLSWPTLLDLLPPLRPRHYSISSSPGTSPHHVDLMVSLLQAPARSGRGDFRGTGSGYLNVVQPGDTVLARVQPCREAFRITHDADTPLVMIAAGTGLAPFRGAITDRRARAANGAGLARALCYFGCDAPDADYLHADELREAEQEGAISVRPAFSEAPVDGQRFVQHRIAAEGDEVWELLEAGARVYVCGDGARMAPAVRDTFRTLYRRNTPGADDAAAHDWLQKMSAEARYVEDVYAG